MADADDAAYALHAPDVRRDDTVTRQLQREILGQEPAERLQDDASDASLAAHTRPEARSDAASFSAKNQEEVGVRIEDDVDTNEEKEHKTEEEELLSSEQRRRTLSPSKAALLHPAETLDAAISRRDTVSPEALKAVLRAAEEEERHQTTDKKKSSPVKSMETSQVRHSGEDGSSERRKSPSDDIQDSPARSTRSKTTLASKRPRSATKKTLSLVRSVEERRKSTSMVNTSDSFTDMMFAPNLLEQDAVRRTTLDPTEAAAVVSALQEEMRHLSTSVLEIEDEADKDERRSALTKVSKIKVPTPSRLTKGKKVSTPSKESNNRPKELRRRKTLSPSHEPTRSKSPSPLKEASSSKSPSPAQKDTSSKAPSPAKEVRSSKSPSPAKEVRSSKSPSPAKEVSSSKSPSSTSNNSMRRMTVDPSDTLVMLEGIVQLEQNDDRRQTIDEDGLLELTRAQECSSTVDEDPATQTNEASRKRANGSSAREEGPEKRARSTEDDRTMESMDFDLSVHADTSQSSLLAKNRQKTSSNNQRSPDKSPPSGIPKPMLNSSPGSSRLRTPLKGILSARKVQQNPVEPVQTTPNKSVNFGPSQGAEFNHGSPSTSMTPMLAKDALRLFPLEPPASSEEEPDDAETSLNSSILDEADSLGKAELKTDSVAKTIHLKKTGFDLLQSRRNSFLATKVSEKSHRRHSMRGYSPLDSQIEVRRRRRQTINVTRQTSNLVSATATSLSENSIASSQSPSLTRKNSFLRATGVLETGRVPYVDSSASSDAGEDMEITGDYSFVLGRDSGTTANQLASSAGQLRDENTAEFSLGHLLAESSVYELTKSTADPDDQDLPGTFGDLLNEVAVSQDSQTSGALRKLTDQAAALDSIEERDETMASSQGHSMMSLDSNESDEEHAADPDSVRKGSSKSEIERVSAEDESCSQRPASPGALPVRLITMDELLSSVVLNEENALVEWSDTSFEGETASSGNQMSKNVKLALAYDTCSKVVECCARDVSSWSTAVTEELSSLLDLKAPAVFSPENLDDAGREAISELYATEAIVARTGWCQLQAHVEKQLATSLSLGADALANDVKSLKDRVSADALKRQNELAAIKEMIEREEQMALLLDAIEEQQGAHDEYATAVIDLEKECSSLSLEESVLQSRLKVLEGRAAELEPVTAAAASLFEQEVLATEEMLVIQESMSVWKIREATASALRLSARFEDVLFDVEICVDVHVGSSSMGGTSTSIKTNEFLKHKERNMYLPYECDAVLVLQRLLLDPHYISQIADESDLVDKNHGHTLSKLQILEHFIIRSFRLLKELRELSTHFAMRYSEEDSTLWVDFLKFPSAASRIDVECIQFSVGFSLLPVYPYTDYQTAVQVPHGQVSCDAVAKEIEQVSKQEPKYFARVCRQLYASFLR